MYPHNTDFLSLNYVFGLRFIFPIKASVHTGWKQVKTPKILLWSHWVLAALLQLPQAKDGVLLISTPQHWTELCVCCSKPPFPWFQNQAMIENQWCYCGSAGMSETWGKDRESPHATPTGLKALPAWKAARETLLGFEADPTLSHSTRMLNADLKHKGVWVSFHGPQ